jgi:hypothetical protein
VSHSGGYTDIDSEAQKKLAPQARSAGQDNFLPILNHVGRDATAYDTSITPAGIRTPPE